MLLAREIVAYRLPAGCGLGCLVLLMTSRFLPFLFPTEGVAQVTWLVLTVLLSGVCGYRAPALGWRSGAALLAAQWVFLLILFVGTCELIAPSSSTGGPVALAIVTMLMALVSPLHLSAAQLGAWTRRWREARRSQAS